MATTVLIGQMRWGSGVDLDAAKRRFKREGGQLTRGYTVLTFDDETEFLGVDQMGRYSWRGNAPQETAVPPRARKSA